MLATVSDELTNRFYQWEQRGRGWQVFDFSVELEPEFHPFFGHFTALPEIHDDGKRQTILSSLASLFTVKKPAPRPDESWADIPPIGAFRYERDTGIVAFGVVLPKDEKLAVSDMQQLLLMLSYTTHPVSFEVIATDASISTQIACRPTDESHVYAQIKAYFPTAVVIKSEEGVYIIGEEAHHCVIDLGLKDEFMRPLCMADEVDQDPYLGLFATFEHLNKGERGCVQILIRGTANPWSESIMRAVSDGEGGSFFADDPEMLKLAQRKVSEPLFAVCIRVTGQSKDKGNRAIEIAKSIGTALIHLTSSKANTLETLWQDEYSNEALIADVMLRESHRIGMLLNAGELATLAHFPTPEIASPKVERDTKRTKAAPLSTRGHPFILGKNTHHGKEELVSIPANLRLKHTHVIGATGTGKSTLLLSMIAQDMEQGNGFAVLDPHGDLIEAALAYVPEERIKDVILIDPVDGDYPVAFNILSAHSEIEKDILSSDLVAAFRRLSTSWGDQMNSVLANAILVFLESPGGGTLIDFAEISHREVLQGYLSEDCARSACRVLLAA